MKIFNILLILFFLGLISISIVYIAKDYKSVDEKVILGESKSYIKYDNRIQAPQLQFNGVKLIDNTTYYPNGSALSSRKGMTIYMEKHQVKVADVKSGVMQKVDFTWNGAIQKNIGWIFVYEGDLVRGNISLYRNLTRYNTYQRVTNNWVNNYLVNGVINYTNSSPPSYKCDVGNTNNTQMYLVNIKNGTSYYSAYYCFTTFTAVNATAFRISGNYNTYDTYQLPEIYQDYSDISQHVKYLGKGLLGEEDTFSYYQIDNSTFDVGETKKTSWNYVPANNARYGKWHILGYDSDIGVVQSVAQDKYIYMDPSWTTADCRAVGGNVTIDGDYCVHVFPANNSFNVSTNIPSATVLIVAGGGGAASAQGGPGGAGGLIYNSSMNFSVGTYPVIIGAGGSGGAAGGKNFGTNGANSSINGYVAVGGGGGGAADSNDGKVGGSGGGSGPSSGNKGGLPYQNQGYSGGNSTLNYANGGGGGAGWLGNNTNATGGGNGGIGRMFTITGADAWFGGGGGGGGYDGTATTVGKGGLGGGGNAGAIGVNQGQAGIAGTGGGAGGNSIALSSTIAGAAGGSGIVIVRYTILNYTESISTTLNSPNNNSIFNITNIGFNFTVNPNNVNITNYTFYVWYSNGVIKHEHFNDTTSLRLNSSTVFQHNDTVFSADVDYVWNVKSCGKSDTSGNTTCMFATSNRTVIVDREPPSLTLYNLTVVYTNITLPSVVDLNVTASDPHLGNCFYTTSENSTITLVTCNQSTRILLYSSGVKTITYYANDTAGNLNSTTHSIPFLLFETNQTYNSTAYEMSTQGFNINITYNSSSYLTISANLIYDGTSYTGTKVGTGDNVSFYKSIDVPLAGQKNLLWQIGLTNTTSTYYYNSSVKTQTLSPIWLIYCNSSINVTSVNFTLYDSESISTKVNGAFKNNFNYWSSLGTGVNKKNFTFEDNNNTNSSFRFCIYPDNLTYYTDADIQFSAPLYSQNYHYYNGVLLNSNIKEQSLYLLNSSKSTITELRVINNYQVGQSKVFIQIQKYDIGTGKYNSIGMAKTNYDGRDIVYLNWYDTFYKFIGIDSSGKVLFNYDPYKVSSTPQTFTVSQSNTFTYDKYLSMQYTLYYNNDTGNVVLTFLDPTGLISAGCLRVNKISSYGGGILYDECLSSTSGTLTYNMGNNTGTFVATFYGKGNNGYTASLNFIREVANEIYDSLDKKDAAVYTFIVVGVSIFLGLFSPVAAIIFGLAGWLLAGSLGFVKINAVYFIGMVIVGGYIAWKLRN